MAQERLTGHVTEDTLAQQVIAGRAESADTIYDPEQVVVMAHYNALLDDVQQDVRTWTYGQDEPEFSKHPQSYAVLRKPPQHTITNVLLPGATKPGEGMGDVIYDTVVDVAKAVRFTRQHSREVGAAVTAAAALASGVIANTPSQSDKAPIQQPIAAEFIISQTPNTTIVHINDDLESQNIPDSLRAAEGVVLGPRDDRIVGNVNFDPQDNNLSMPAVDTEVAYATARAFMLQDAITDVDKTQTTNTSAISEAVSPASETKKPEVIPQVEALNKALDSLDFNAKSINISPVVEAVKNLYAWYKPQDTDRLPNTPEGYVKMMLPNEVPGLEYLFTVAERTANVERYTSPTAAAIQYANTRLVKILGQKYPQYKDTTVRVRDNNAPEHSTHNTGREVDLSTANGLNVTQYSTGPMADYEFSKEYSQAYSVDMAVTMSRYTDANGPVISSLLTSSRNLVRAINPIVGRNFMQLHLAHDDHFHMTLMRRLALTQWRPTARQLPWSGNQDLKIGAEAIPLTQQQIDSQHGDFEKWEWAKQTSNRAQQQPETTSNPEAIAFSDQLPQNTLDQLKPFMARIEKLKPIYQEIAAKTGVKWEYLAALHMREGGDNPESSMWAGEKLGARNPDTGKVEGTTLIENGTGAAEHFKAMAKTVYGVDVTSSRINLDDLAKAFVAYNRGGLYKLAKKHIGHEMNPSDSPYASNGLAGHEHMHFPGQGESGSWGEPNSVQGTLDRNPGALAVIIALQQKQTTTPQIPSTTTTSLPPSTTTTMPEQEPTESTTSTESTTTTQPEIISQKVVETGESIPISATAAKRIGSVVLTDPTELDAWLKTLPTEQVDGETKYVVTSDNVPQVTVKGDK